MERAQPAGRREEALDLGVGQRDQFLLRPGRGLVRPADYKGQVLATMARYSRLGALPAASIDRVLIEDPFDGRIEQTREFQVGDRLVVPEIDRNYRRRLEAVEVWEMGVGDLVRQHAPQREIGYGADDHVGIDPLPAPQRHAGGAGAFKLDPGDVGVQSNLPASVFD